ncbi:hypothetical protein [Pantoea sp.]|uniref:RipA family octameric membrane protein n=1 Tax=Pantoea sp. TaxID=69393 RepID=UPI0028A09200|nr:hypothetical protein [Pantoea sp.]
MRITIEPGDKGFIDTFFAEPTGHIDQNSPQAERLRESLQDAYRERSVETDAEWKRTLCFLLLFVFLYIVLGISLTLDLSVSDTAPKSIAWALHAVPVLIAFSGYFISLLFLFFNRSSAFRKKQWDRAIAILERYCGRNMHSQLLADNPVPGNYSLSAINIALALFICVTWVVMYNYFTFTTSGVIGSVISLFITTMTYVILDIQLLKSVRQQTQPGADRQVDEPRDD